MSAKKVEMQQRMERCRKFGDVTKNGVVFEWWLVNANGAGFALFIEPHHKPEDINFAEKLIRGDRDVVGKVQRIQVGE